MSAWLPILNIMAESAIIFAFVFLVARLLGPQLRVTLFRCGTILALAAPLAVFAIAPSATLFVVPSVSGVRAPSAAAAPSPAIATPGAPTARPAAVDADGAPSLPVLLAILWAIGALGAFAPYLLSLLTLSRAFSRAGPAPEHWNQRLAAIRSEMELKRRVTLRLSRAIAAPCTFGFLHIRILVPARLALSPDAQNAVLAHELCHARHHDALWLMLGRLAASVHWFNPFAWLCLARYRDDIEAACDDAVVVRHDTHDYAEALVEACRSLMEAHAPAAAMMSAQGIAARVKRLIEREDTMHQPSTLARLSLYAGTAFAAAMVATTGLVSAESARPPGAAMIVAENAWHDIDESVGENEGLLYLSVARGLHVRSEDAHFMCGDDAHCVFSLDRGMNVTLSADEGAVRWQGCTSSDGGRTCAVQISRNPVRITVSRAD